MWQHKFQVCNFVATQKLKLNFCVATKKVIDKKFFLCCHNFANQIFVLPQDFDFKSCGSTKSPKFLIFYTLKKEKIRGNSRQFFFWILENSGDFWWFQWFGKIEKHCTVAVKFIFFKSKKTQTSFFLVEIAIDCTLKVHFQALPASSNARQHQLGQSCVPCTCNKQSRCAKKLQSFLISLSMLELTVQWSFHQLPALRLFVCFEKEALYSVKFAENKKELTWYLW